MGLYSGGLIFGSHFVSQKIIFKKNQVGDVFREETNFQCRVSNIGVFISNLHVVRLQNACILSISPMKNLEGASSKSGG